MENSGKTTEPQLRDYNQAGVISAAKIVKTADGYVLVIQVSWKLGELIVFNHRGTPRTWVSMDRLLAYITETVPTIRELQLLLDQPSGWPKADSPRGKKPVPERTRSTRS